MKTRISKCKSGIDLGNPIFGALVLESILAGSFFLLTVFQPSLTNSQLFFGFSKNRLYILGFYLLALILSIIGFVTIKSNENISKSMNRHFNSLWFSFAVVLMIIISFMFLIITFIPETNENQLLAERIRPFIIFLFVSGINFLGFQCVNKNQSPRNFISSTTINFIDYCDSHLTNFWMVLIAICLGIPLLFQGAYNYIFPSGFAGLYVLMSELIVNNNFQIPQYIPYYGPGGIPFAYPPIGPYLLAVVSTLFHISIINYLRFVPPFIMLLSIIPIYYIAFEITHSRFGSFFCSFKRSGIHVSVANPCNDNTFGTCLNHDVD